MKNIYDLELHEDCQLNRCETVKRVPGGWIYRWIPPDGKAANSTFVPYDNGFDERHLAKPEKPA